MGNKANSVTIGERRIQAYQYRLEGKTLRDIGKLLGVSKDTVANDIKAELDKRLTPLAAEERKRQLDQLDMAIAKVWAILENEIYVVSHGKVVLDPGTDKPMIDHEMTIKVAGQFANLLDRRAKLTGAYMPVQIEQTVETVDSTDLAIRSLIDQQTAKNALDKQKLRDKQERSA